MMKALEESCVSGKKEIIIDSGGKKIKFYAHEISYLSYLNIDVQSQRGKNRLALMVAESISDEQGFRFTYEEVLRFKKNIAEPFFDAVIEINNLKASEEKKS